MRLAIVIGKSNRQAAHLDIQFQLVPKADVTIDESAGEGRCSGFQYACKEQVQNVYVTSDQLLAGKKWNRSRIIGTWGDC